MNNTGLRSAREVPVEYGLLWWKSAWKVTMNHFGFAFLMFVLLAVSAMIINKIPLIGNGLQAFVQVFLQAGILLVVRDWLAGEDPSWQGLFAGFSETSILQKIMPLALINLVIGIGSGIYIFISDKLGLGAFLVVTPLLILSFVSLLLLAFALPLILFKEVPLREALGLSFKACTINWLSLLLNGLLVSGLLILASLPLGLGLIVVMPTLLVMPYLIYATIFQDMDLSGAEPPLNDSTQMDI